MRAVQLQQGTPEWLAWRKGVIGGSDAPAIEGNCPYRTLRAVYCDKKDIPYVGGREISDYMSAQGKKVEELIRTDFRNQTGVEMFPACGEHDKFKYIAGSFDGLDLKKLGVLEAKLVGAEVLAAAKSKAKIPDHHMTQIQHLMEVADVDTAHWYGHDGKQLGIVVPIKRDKKYAKGLLEKEHAFHDLLITSVLPALSPDDYLVPDDQALLEQLRDAKELMDNSKIDFESLKEKAAKLYGHVKVSGAGIKLFQTSRGGGTNWAAIPEIAVELAPLQKKFQEAAARHEAKVQKILAKHQKVLAGDPNYVAKFALKPTVSWTVQMEKVKVKKS